jgi:hypothetical protein
MSAASIPGHFMFRPLLVGLVAVLVLGGFMAFISTAIVASSPDMGNGTAALIGLLLTVGGMLTGGGLTWIWYHRDPRDPSE